MDSYYLTDPANFNNLLLFDFFRYKVTEAENSEPSLALDYLKTHIDWKDAIDCTLGALTKKIKDLELGQKPNNVKVFRNKRLQTEDINFSILNEDQFYEISQYLIFEEDHTVKSFGVCGALRVLIEPELGYFAIMQHLSDQNDFEYCLLCKYEILGDKLQLLPVNGNILFKYQQAFTLERFGFILQEDDKIFCEDHFNNQIQTSDFFKNTKFGQFLEWARLQCLQSSNL